LERGGSSAVGRGPAGRPDHDQKHCYHHAPTVKPEAATAVHMGCEVNKVVLSMVSTDKPPSPSFLSRFTALRTAKT